MKKILLSILTLLALAGLAHGQVIISNSVTGSGDIDFDDAKTFTFEINASTTENSIIAVFIGLQDYSTFTYDSVTLEGVAMTAGISDFAVSDMRGAFYYLPTQVVGDNTFSVTTSETSGNERGIVARAFVLEGVDENQTPVTASNTLGDGAATTMDVSVTPAADGSAVLGYAMRDSGSVDTFSQNYFDPLNDLGSLAFSGSEIGVSATTQNIDWTVVKNDAPDNTVAMSVAFSQIPEPSAATLLLGSAGILLLLRRRRA